MRWYCVTGLRCRVGEGVPLFPYINQTRYFIYKIYMFHLFLYCYDCFSRRRNVLEREWVYFPGMHRIFKKDEGITYWALIIIGLLGARFDEDWEYDLARENLQIKFFKLNSWSPGASFFPIVTINLLSLKRIRDSDFKNNFVIIKREINTFKKFPCDIDYYFYSMYYV